MASPTRDVSRPTSSLPRFHSKKFWDADSTPPALAALSRDIGELLPQSGARTPHIEAAVVMASLMHDVSYYYGGTRENKAAVDGLFGQQIPSFASRLSDSAGQAARVTAAVDVAVVTVAGGWPFQEKYSWSYGFELQQRGFHELKAGEVAKIERVAQETFVGVVSRVAAGRVNDFPLVRAKLANVRPEYRCRLKTCLVDLARSLQTDLATNPGSIPGF
jgi:hypothetical protein